jgi:hypothetical protein
MTKTKKAPVKSKKVKKDKAKASPKYKNAVITVILRRTKTGSVSDVVMEHASPADMVMAINSISKALLEELDCSISVIDDSL